MTSTATLHPDFGTVPDSIAGYGGEPPGCGPLDAASAAVSGALDRGVWSRSDDELVADVGATLALRAQIDGLLLTQLAEVEARGIPARRGCPPTRAWLRAAHRIGPGEASDLVKTALSLRDDLPAVGAALAAGEMSLAQAQVCVHAIADLPSETSIARRPQAEATMIESARSFDPVLLARIGRRLAEIIDPDGVQARDEKPDRDKEDDAYRARDLSLTPSSNSAGGTLRAKLDAVGYATLATYLAAATAPRVRPEGNTEGPAAEDTRTVGQLRHDALVEALRQSLAAGGVKPRIIITIPWTSLRERTGAGALADGTQLSPTLTAQIADDAELVPVWLSPTGIPLDVGRTVRLFTGRIRTALEARDRGCAWPGCDRPPSWTQAHHIRPWLDGGPTDLTNGVLLCLFHHHQIERGDWTVTIRGGRAWFTPPRWIDPEQKPLLNLLHHPPPTT